jgi:hypothetical protein
VLNWTVHITLARLMSAVVHKSHEYIFPKLLCRETMPASEILIYAELLPNIRQISIVAELDTPSDATTTVKLAAEGRQVVLHHNAKDTVLPLPGQVAPQAHIQALPIARKDLTYRLPLAGAFQRADVDDAQSISAPWSAQDLIPDAQFTCRKCNSAVIETGRIKEWRDLPSENWAEMMDFWHCHKPSEHGRSHTNGEHTDLESTKGYGANSMFTAQSGIGFVDLTSFLIMESDCLSISQVNDFSLRPAFIFYVFQQALGIKKETRSCCAQNHGLFTDTNALDQKYCHNLLRWQSIMLTLFSGLRVPWSIEWLAPLHFTPYFSQDS